MTKTAFGQPDTVFIKYDPTYDDDVGYHTDTVIFETPNRQILYGTTLLPSTDNQTWIKNFGLSLDSVSITECEQEAPPRGDNKIISIAETDTTFKYRIKMFANCCHSFLCDAAIEQDSIVNLIFYGYGAMRCDCTCCYGLDYHFSTMPSMANYKKLKMVLINGNKKTLKKINVH